MEKLLETLETSRNNYINEAIEFYNAYQERQLLVATPAGRVGFGSGGFDGSITGI
ncbi:MAG: hypothetical protein LRZ85_08000 [Alphaproteobacteria bacterium]|nr:hypothetical protein [Alphaproteobacteria bacterium]